MHYYTIEALRTECVEHIHILTYACHSWSSLSLLWMLHTIHAQLWHCIFTHYCVFIMAGSVRPCPLPVCIQLAQSAVAIGSVVGVWLITASDHIELHRTLSEHVCKREIVISKAKPKSAVITFRANMPPGTQLAHSKLGRYKSSIRPRSSVAYMSPTVSKTV